MKDREDILDFFKNITQQVTDKKSVESFIAEHRHINYCEAIIFPTGEVAYVKPSHIETMLREFDCSREEAYDKIPITETPIEWLLNETNCIAVWSSGWMKPSMGNVTKQSQTTLEKLIEVNLVYPENMRDNM